MRKVFAGMCAVVFALAIGAPAFAETVKGELVDQSCYMKDHKNVGESHKACAVKCATKGQQVALVTSDGKVIEVQGELAANNNEKLVPHMSHTVQLTGDMSEKDGKMIIMATSLKMAK